MHNGAWETLLRHIPADLQNKFTIMTTSGTEITIQCLLRVEKELVVFKGRLSGSQDQGRLFFLSFQNIDYIGTLVAITDAQFAEVFDSLQFPEPPQSQSLPAVAPDPDEPLLPPSGSNGQGNGHGAGSGSGVRRAIRSEVLERFRSARPSAPSSSVDLPRPPQQ